MEKLVIIVGPTAVGKSALSIEIAGMIDGEIISGDSMQVYKGMNIGTAKISPEEMFFEEKFIPHYLIDILEPWENYSVARFQTQAKEIITDINKRGKIPIIVGGTGLYIQSIIDPYFFTPLETDENYRQELLNLAKQHGATYLHEMLAKVDKISAEKIHPNNLKRVIRALEVYHLTGQPISANHSVIIGQKPLYNLAYIGLSMDRELLYSRIDERVDKMISKGLINEVKRLLDLPYPLSKTAAQAIGYKEIISYLDGQVTLDEAIQKIKTETKHFAKRQQTWFKRDARISWYDVKKYTNFRKLAKRITEEICRTFQNSVE